MSSEYYEHELKKLLQEARVELDKWSDRADRYRDDDGDPDAIIDLVKRIDTKLAEQHVTGTTDEPVLLRYITKSAQEIGQIRVDQCFEGMTFARLQRVQTRANAFIIEFRAPVVPDVRYLSKHNYDLDGAQHQRSLIVKTDGVKVTVRDVMGCKLDPCAWHPDECLKVVDGKLKPDPDAEEAKAIKAADEQIEKNAEDPDW